MAWNSTRNPKIREIIHTISSAPHTPTQLSKKLNLHEVTISRYLKILRDDNLVKIRRKQNELYYSLDLNKWEKHVEETMNLAGDNFTNKFKKHLEKKSSNQKIWRNLQGDKKNEL